MRYPAGGQEWDEWVPIANLLARDVWWLVGQDQEREQCAMPISTKLQPTGPIPRPPVTPAEIGRLLSGKLGHPATCPLRKRPSSRDEYVDGDTRVISPALVEYVVRDVSAGELTRMMEGYCVHPDGRPAVWDIFAAGTWLHGNKHV